MRFLSAVFLLSLTLSYTCGKTTLQRAEVLLDKQLLNRVSALKNHGETHLSRGSFGSAGVCYSAACQLLAGQGGDSAVTLRGECGARAAECCLGAESYLECIAASSAVIDEDPPPRQGVLPRAAVGAAHLHRALALYNLGMDEFSAPDVSIAKQAMPNNKLLRNLQIKLQKNNIVASSIDEDGKLQFVELLEDICISHPPRLLPEKDLLELIKKGTISDKEKLTASNRIKEMAQKFSWKAILISALPYAYRWGVRGLRLKNQVVHVLSRNATIVVNSIIVILSYLMYADSEMAVKYIAKMWEG
jgi:hypothetical protein